MRTYIKNNKGLFVKLCFIVLFLVFFIILLILKTNQDICESWTRSFARFYNLTIGTVFKWVPFSLSEWIIAALVIMLVVFLVLFIRNLVKKRYTKSFHKLANIGLIVFASLSLYFATCEMAYNRAPLAIEVYEQNVEKSEFKNIVEYFVNDMNYCISTMEIDPYGEIIQPYSSVELNDKLEAEYHKLDDNDYFAKFTTRCKPLLTSFIFRELHITGVTVSPLTEANFNDLQTTAEKPFTCAHEMAHSKGVMRENDAQMVASYICLNSNDPYIRFSGYCSTIWSLIDLLNYTGVANDYSSMVSNLSEKYVANHNYRYYYWTTHNAFQEFANWWNNLYLKASGEEKGTESYQDVPVVVDPTTREISSFSNYQKLFFSIYFN